MMKLAAIDYDGTLFVDGQVSQRDLDAIKHWRAEGYLFALVTGRDFTMAVHEIERYFIPIDYLICNTGASIYDSRFRKLYSSDLPSEAVEIVQKHPASADSRYFLYSMDENTYWDVRDPNSWLATLNLPLERIDSSSALHLRGVQQIALEYSSAPEAAKCVDLYNKTLGPKYQAHQTGFCADIVAAGVDKATGLARLTDLLNLGDIEILPLGDSENDLPMVLEYNGYAMRDGSPQLKSGARALCDSVAQMLLWNLV